MDEVATPDKVEAIIKLVSQGGTVLLGCEEQEISGATFYRWIDENDDLKEKYVAAKRQSHKARCDKALNVMSRAMDKDDQVAVNASKFILERSPGSDLRAGTIQIPANGEIRIVIGADPGEGAEAEVVDE